MLMLKKLKSKKGAALVEYGILLGLIAVVVIATVTTLGEQVDEVFKNITTELEKVNGTVVADPDPDEGP